ncbi:tRNA pseudouridine(38-40) synthase TruA [Nevskia ramosa]|uniref:tRNA pseudouridine(38-40) synthase TruA n=1 Tax=Nevskia ramosa TaxID=64002 RepID=UPI0003B3F635|nr:tRNA pseudouridine(38-40) synthase TruA [Nevskia ramosa]
MVRWVAGVEYHGSRYSGWQIQARRPSVQGAVEAALSSVANQPVATICAGRTDSGVHALGQVVHFDSAAARDPYGWLLGSNSRLPPDIALRWVQPVAGDFSARFSARFSATSRRYRYVIHNDRARSALLAERATWIAHALDADAMHEAAQALVGEHDFSAFRAAECQAKTATRRLESLHVWRSRQFVVIDVRANAFLHHMVRNITGSLLEVGSQRRPAAWIAELLAGRDRSLSGMTAAAQGLYFVGPDYPAEFGLPPPSEPWFPA